MSKTRVFLVFLIISPFILAHVIPPSSVLDRGYQSCINNGSDPRRTAYCACLREGIKNWNLETYAKIAWNMPASGSQGSLPSPLGDLTQQCNAQVLEQ